MILPQITLTSSIRLAWFFAIIHLGAILCVILPSVNMGLKITLLALSGLSLAWCLLHYAWVWLPWSVVKVWVDADGTWHLQSKNGRVRTASLQGDSVVTPWLMVLNFKYARKWPGIPVLVCPGNADAIGIRRLRLYLI